MKDDNRNIILAVVLSAIVLIGWSFISERWFPTPRQPVQTAQQAGMRGVADTAVPGVAAAPSVQPVGTALAAAPRVKIDTPRLAGSINLAGARFDDLVLKDHKVSLEANSPPVRLFAPSGSAEPYFAGFGWTGAGAPPADAQWTASADTLSPGKPVTLSSTGANGVTWRQTIAVDENFLFTVTTAVTNGSAAPVDVRPYGYVNRTGRGPDKGGVNQHVGPVAVIDGSLKDSDIKYDTLRDDGPLNFRTTGGWMGISDKYWLAALIPNQKSPVEARFTAADRDRYQVDWLESGKTLQPGQTVSDTSRLYAGAKEVRLLNAVRDQFGVPLFDRAMPWGWFWFIAQPIFSLLQWLYGIFGNYALAIIGLTLIVRLLLFPIANKQYSSMAKMRIFAPKMKELQEKYKDDKVKQQQAMMELYKQEKINPLAGCLPIFLQIPIFYALYKVLLISVELRHQPAFLWIHDLSAPDPLTPFNLFGLINWTPPGFLHLGVLSIILGITMFMQFKLNPQPMDEMQAKIFAWMPWLFMFMMAPFAAGLHIYWITNNLVSMLQQWMLLKKYPAPAPAPKAAK